jgi:hypothetical protein
MKPYHQPRRAFPLASSRNKVARRAGPRRGILAYCRGPYCAFAPEAVRTLRAHGYAALHFTDGLPEWVAVGNGVQSDEAGFPTADR